MLVLTRKLMERLYIGEDICVTIVRLEGGQVRLGIEAPRHIPVVRAELVPDRAMPPPRSALPTTPERPLVNGFTNPPVAIPGIGIRRRGPSR